MARGKLIFELSKTPLGKVLASSLLEEKAQPEMVDSFFPSITTEPAPKEVLVEEYWRGAKILPKDLDPLTPSQISAIWEKKGGDFPAFWTNEASFLQIAEEIHDRVRQKNKLE